MTPVIVVYEATYSIVLLPPRMLYNRHSSEQSAEVIQHEHLA